VIATLESGLAGIVADPLSRGDIAARLGEWAEAVRQARQQHPQETDAFLAFAEKTLSPVLPDDSLFAAKTQIAQLQQEFTDLPHIVVVEKQRTERLWEARRLAESGKLALAEAIVRDASAQIAAEPIAAAAAESVLAEKQEQLVVLGEIQKDGVAPAIVTRAESEIITASSRLLRPAFPDPSPLALAQKAADIIERVERYKSPVGQKNTLRHHLDRLGESGENLRLLAEIKEQVPGELKPAVSEQIIALLASEREKVRQTQVLPTAAPCVADCAPPQTLLPETATPTPVVTTDAQVPEQNAALPVDDALPVSQLLTPVDSAPLTPSLVSPLIQPDASSDLPAALPPALD
jgi:hypothetical protein